MATYGQGVVWRRSLGGRTGVVVDGYATPELASAEAWRAAGRSGYTVPRWWHVWRWRDSRPQTARDYAALQQGADEAQRSCNAGAPGPE